MTDMRQADLRLPLYQQVRDALARDIANRVWKPGEAIPTEAELVGRFHTSIGTIRKAVDQLVADEMVERRQGKGTFIKPANFQSSLLRFFRFHDAAGNYRIPEAKILHREQLTPPPAIADSLQLSPGAQAIHLTRLRYLDREPLLAESIWLPATRFQALLAIPLPSFGDLLYPLYEDCCHQVVASAREILTAEAIASPHAELLQLAPGTPAIVLERLAKAYDGSPLEWRSVRGRADKFRYQADIR
ncbi:MULTISPECIES: GntR family transcriptional regulator [Chromobacterium]|uniref:GntR family transcriptional regulator n=1 Tax=Chromobacterium TaxID=535 RepID=UPI0018EE6FE5|nr:MULTISPECIES: GntR family transcriptional regulator [Chromobacterium]